MVTTNAGNMEGNTSIALDADYINKPKRTKHKPKRANNDQKQTKTATKQPRTSQNEPKTSQQPKRTKNSQNTTENKTMQFGKLKNKQPKRTKNKTKRAKNQPTCTFYIAYMVHAPIPLDRDCCFRFVLYVEVIGKGA